MPDVAPELVTAATAIVAAVRGRRPLVHRIGPGVTAPIVANGLLAAGARPLVTDTADEAPALVRAADALVVGTGSLSGDARAGIPPTVAATRDAGVPWVLDPAAIGVAPVRTRLAHDLLRQGPAVVRGNASELLVLGSGGSGGRGADAVHDPEDALEAAREVARRSGAVVAVSGAVDVVTDGDRVVRVEHGSPLLARVTGTGCLLAALVGACLAVAPEDPVAATLAATWWLTLAAEDADPLGSRTPVGPGTFSVRLLDALDRFEPTSLAELTEGNRER